MFPDHGAGLGDPRESQPVRPQAWTSAQGQFWFWARLALPPVAGLSPTGHLSLQGRGKGEPLPRDAEQKQTGAGTRAAYSRVELA